MAETVPSTFDDPQAVASLVTDSAVLAKQSHAEAVVVTKKIKKKVTGSVNTKVVRGYPAFPEMIVDAIVTLKERKGSSQYAITKFIENKQKNLPSNFKKLLLSQLKKLVAAQKILKVKGSFKVLSSKPKNPKSVAGTSLKKKVSVVRKPKVTKKILGRISKIAGKPIVGSETKVAAKAITKAKAVVEPKSSLKSKIAVSKKVAAKSTNVVSKPKAPVSGFKRKIDVVKPISKKVVPPAKISKISLKGTPVRKAAPVKKAVLKKATPLKVVAKSKGGKSPVSRKGPARKGKK